MLTKQYYFYLDSLKTTIFVIIIISYLNEDLLFNYLNIPF